MSRFVPVDRDTAYLLPPSVDEWLPSDHLARFVVEVIDRLDLDDLVKQYAGRGSAAHHPAVLLIYGYANGVHSSRKIERATYDSVAFRYVAANTHPDHDTLATFRRRFLKEVEALFVQVLVLAREMKLLKLGHIALDGTKIGANASKHKALSWAHAHKIEAQLRQEVQTLLALAEKSDRAKPDGMDVPAEIARREDRLSAIAQAKAKIEQRALERHKAEQQEFEAKQAKRQAQREAGKKPRGKDPEPPQAGPKDGDQVNLTDEASRIMPVSGGGFEQSYNAQAGVDMDTMLVVTAHLTQACNDKREVVPTLKQIANDFHFAEASQQATPISQATKLAALNHLKVELSQRGWAFEIEGERELRSLVPSPFPSVATLAAGERCTVEGYWVTPASSSSRRKFLLGEVMPDIKNDYGKTIWQWDGNQP